MVAPRGETPMLVIVALLALSWGLFFVFGE
jgi:hypothetical protein